MSAPKRVHVLVTDDNQINRQYATGVLSHYGVQAVAAESGPQAIDLALKHLPPVLLMDIHMPGMDGLRTLREIMRLGRQLDYFPQAAALTADARLEERQRLLSAGFDAFLAKPATAKQILDCVTRLSEPAAINLTAADIQAPATDRDESILQTGDALQALNHSNSLLQRLRQMFATELKQEIPQLDQMMKQGSYGAAGELLHKLAASCGYCGAKRLSSSISELQTMLQLGGTRKLAASYAQFLRECNAVAQALDDDLTLDDD